MAPTILVCCQGTAPICINYSTIAIVVGFLFKTAQLERPIVVFAESSIKLNNFEACSGMFYSSFSSFLFSFKARIVRFVVDVRRMQFPSSASRKRATLRNPFETYGRISTFTEQSLGLISVFTKLFYEITNNSLSEQTCQHADQRIAASNPGNRRTNKQESF